MMKRSLVLAVGAALSLAACSDASPVATRTPDAAPLLAAPSGGIGGSYVVVLNEGADPHSVAAVAGIQPKFVYTAAINGFSASLNAGQLNALRHNPSVAYVEQDQAVRAGGVQTTAIVASVPWGLDRIDQRSLPLDGATPRHGSGAGVTAYVIDTGINTAHVQFGGRAQIGYDAFGGNGQDCHGRGTDMAAVIGGSTYGVAKGVRLVGVRVLDCNLSGTIAGVIAGVDWVRLNHTRPAVAAMALNAASSASLNTAVNNLANAGVFLGVAAGDGNQNACNVSPPGAAAATAVAASTITDARATFSNFGSCVDLYAPGVNIPTASGTRSGTSMAASHVTGAAALYKAGSPGATSATVTSWLNANATPNVITGNPVGTPNRLLYISTL
jgi:subtilisin family serine protease